MSKDSNPDAEAIVRRCLEETGAALLSGDYPRLVKHFRLPHISETFEGTRVFETANDMKRAFNIAVTYYRNHNVTQIQRDVLAAVFVSETRIHATHQTRLLAKTTLVKTPHTAFSEVHKIEGRWKAAVTRYAITDAPALESALGGDTMDAALTFEPYEGCED